MKWLRIGVVFGVLVAAAGTLRFLGPREQTAPRAPVAVGAEYAAAVAEVIDGDTLRLEGGQRVRLLGLDAPEKNHPLHSAARAACRELLGRNPVRLTVAGKRPLDGYGRTLALVQAGEILLNEELLARGLARAYFRSEDDLPADLSRRLVLAQVRAIDRRLGLWALPGALATAPGEKILLTRYRFHRAGCPQIGDRAGGGPGPAPGTRLAALRSGRSPCRICNPRRGRGGRGRSACNRVNRRPR